MACDRSKVRVLVDPKSIETDAEYQRALARIETLFDSMPGTPEGDELESWITLVEAYEEVHFPIEPAKRRDVAEHAEEAS